MKKNLFKITALAILGLVVISTSFAKPAKKENAKVKIPSYEKFVPGQLPEFDEVTGTISVEGKGENQKVYILTDKKIKVLVEVAGGPRFAFEQRPFVEKKDFPNENRPDSKKDFNKDKKGENSKDFEKGKRPEFPQGFDKDKMPKVPEGFDKDKRSENSKDFEKGKHPEFSQGFDKNKMEQFQKDFEKGNFEKPKNFNSLESLTKLKGKKVSLVGKFNSDKTVFNVIGIINK
jgi:hypothetical protein